MSTKISVRDFRNQLSAYLNRTQAGESFIITKYGKPIGHIVPIGPSPKERLNTLIENGRAAWNGQPLPLHTPTIRPRKGRTISELVVEERT